MQTMRGQSRVGAHVSHHSTPGVTSRGWARSRSGTRLTTGDRAIFRTPAPQPHHRHAPLVEAASVAVGTAQQAEGQAAPSSATFNWARQWYPMLVLNDLDPKKPVPLTLMGRSLVVWNDGKAWHCCEDRCPHRLAPLSEGRIEKGQLMCCYHGWTFDGSGKCTSVPQITDPKAQATACSSPRNCVTVYPCKEMTGLLWVWGEGGPQGLASSEQEQVPACTLGFLLQPDSPIKQRTQWFMRDLPIRADTLLENALDPSHVPFAHHGVQGSRNRVVESTYTVAERPSVSEGFKIKQTFTIGGRQREGTFGFKPPVLIDYNLPFGGLHVYVSPTKTGWARLFATFSNNTSNKMPLPFRLFSLLLEGHPAIEHPVMRNKVLDGDTYMLHVAERDLLSHNNDWQKQYYMPANADTPVLALREWIATFSGGSIPTCSPADTPSMPPLMTKREVLDRYSQHTVHCKSCMQTVRRIDAASIAAIVAAATALFTIVARCVVGAQPLLQAPNAWAAAGIAGCLLLLKLLRGFREKFFYEEYEHAYAD